MKKIMVVIALNFALAGCTTGQVEPDPDWDGGIYYDRAIDLKRAAENGNADAMMDLSNLLREYAPDPEDNIVIECDGKQVTPFAKKKLEAKGQDCKLVENEENKRLVKNWRSVGTRANSWEWLERAAIAGNLDAIAIQCALGEFNENTCSQLFD